VPRWFACPYLGVDVELTDERERYILGKHDLVALGGWSLIAETLRDPQEIRRSRTDPKGRVFCVGMMKWSEVST
jgi:hypothetical protein